MARKKHPHDMTVHEFIERREDLAAEIAALILEFQQATDTEVAAIEIERGEGAFRDSFEVSISSVVV